MAEYTRKVLITIGIMAGIAITLLSIYYVLPHFAPFIMAYLFALILEPLNLWIIKRWRINRKIAINATFFFFLGLTSWLAYFATTKITAQLFELVKYVQRNIPSIQAWFLDLYRQIQDFILVLPPEMSNEINSSFSNFINQLTNVNLIPAIGAQTLNISTAIPNLFILLILFFVSLYLISFNLAEIKQKFYSYFTETSKGKVSLVLYELQKATIGFLEAQFILSSITYIISAVGLAILGVGYALVIALIIVIVDILPIVGTGSVLVPWAIFSFTRGNTFLGFGLLILYATIVVLRKAIEPKILGERIGLSPLSTLISIWVGFKVLGITGIFVGPLFIILYKALVKAGVIRFRLKI